METTSIATTTTPADLFEVEIDFTNTKNIFAAYVGGLFLLAYALSAFVAILHLRNESVVFSLTRPEPGAYFTEYIIVIRTSQLIGSTFDGRGRIQIQLLGSFSDSVLLHLKKGKGMQYFMERGTTNIFVYHSPDVLGDIKEITVSLVNDAPDELPYVDWRPAYLSVMHPITRKQWGCSVNKLLRCRDNLTETFKCIPDRRDLHTFYKAFCTFHLWLSLFNNPLRFGMYNNFVNVVMIFTVICGVMLAVLIRQFISKPGKGLFTVLGYNVIYGLILPAVAVWVVELLLEAFFRNTVPRVSACSFSMFQGLIKPVKSRYGVNDFSVNYNWDKVSPLIPVRYVIIPRGTRHASSQSIFHVEPAQSFYNMWGLLDLDVGRFGNMYFRTLNVCALSLPRPMKWLAKEAKSRKDDMLVKQYLSNFTAPMCYFCCWLVDWPLHFVNDSNQIWLIMSHIICSDIKALSQLHKREYRARMAQICVHQWHGMISCYFLYVIKQSMELRGLNVSLVTDFMYRTMTRFGKRSAREIQAMWKQRQIRLTEMNLKKTQEIPIEKGDDDNESALQACSKKFINLDRPLWHIFNLDYDMEPEFTCLEMELNDSFTEDFLIFDSFPTKHEMELVKELKETRINICEEKIVETAARIKPKLVSKFSIVREDKVKRRSRRKSLQHSGTKRKKPKVNHISQEGIENINNTFDTVGGDTDTKAGFKPDATFDLNPGAVASRCNASGDRNINATNNNNQEASSRSSSPPQQGPSKYIRMQDPQATLVQQIVEERQRMMKAVNTERMSLPVATFEETVLGPPFDASYTMEKDHTNSFCRLRHAHEILAYCCNSARCSAFADIHKVVGVSSLEILKKLLTYLLHFALDGSYTGEKVWQRRKIVNDLYLAMQQKAEMYNAKNFKVIRTAVNAGNTCNRALTTVLTTLEVMLEVTALIQEEGRILFELEKRNLYPEIRQTKQRCLFCAKNLEKGVTSNRGGCYNIEKLVKFFSTATIEVAEKEINVEFAYKYSVQRYCATTVSFAIKELLKELDDPPMVLACKVTQILFCKLLERMLPKYTSFKDMTADELRQVGTRRERIQARHDLSLGANKKETDEERRRKKILANVHEQLVNKWRIGAKENELEFCVELLAQNLVHEKIMGYSVYAGFLMRHHDDLLNGSSIRLIEIERKAYEAVLKIAKHIVRNQLKKALLSIRYVDVLFTTIEMETSYVQEAISVAQLNSEPTFLKTCCYYINNIIHEKIEEYKIFAVHMRNFVPTRDLQVKLKSKMFKRKYEIDGNIDVKTVDHHALIASPVLRWGHTIENGIFPIPEELRVPKATKLEFKTIIPEIEKTYSIYADKKVMVSKLLETRHSVKVFLESQRIKKNKHLRTHLAQVQAELTEQVAVLSQTMMNVYALDTDHQREYSIDDLFNVEFYATRHLKHIFPTSLGYVMLLLVIFINLLIVAFVTLKAGNMDVPDVQKWFMHFVFSFLFYVLVLEPVKCIGYRILQVYTQ